MEKGDSARRPPSLPGDDENAFSGCQVKRFVDYDTNPMEHLNDPDKVHHVPEAWRTTIASMVDCFVAGDFALTTQAELPTLDRGTATQIQEYIEDYGEKLVSLPPRWWTSSEVQCMGEHWEVSVDLWTDASSPSDMVLALRVREHRQSFKFEVHMVYVP